MCISIQGTLLLVSAVNQADQEDEREGLEREGLKMEGLKRRVWD
jgi:hypothetical protein